MKKIYPIIISAFISLQAFSQQPMPGDYNFTGHATFSSLQLASPQRTTHDSMAVALIDRSGKLNAGPGTYLQVAHVILGPGQIDSLHIYAALGGYPLLPAPGAEKFLEIYSISAKVIFNSRPYSGFCKLSFQLGGAGKDYTIASDGCCAGGIGSDLLNLSVTNRMLSFKLNQGKATQEIFENVPLTILAEHESPKDGNSAVEFIITYAVVSLQ